jgi:DNA segregation ATPase FtsK/SpoIIIE-like protein
MVMSSAELIEQLMDAPPGSVNIDPVPSDSNAFDVTCIETDPHEEPIEWDEEGVRSIMEDALIGKYADHQEETTAWWEKGIGGFHRLMAGVTRSGKSGLMKLLIAIYAEAADTVFWFADLKDGTALLPFSPLADWTVTTPEDALKMCRALKEVVSARSRELASQGKEVWTPSRKKPVLIVFIDEIAELLGDGVITKIKLQAQASLVSVARKGAGVGVLMVMATQYPTLSALGTSQLKSQLTWRACFRMAQPDQAYYILPGIKSTGIDPYEIDKHRKGTCYVDAEGEFRMAKLRILYFADSMIKGLVERFFGQRPEMDVESLKWKDKELKAVYEARRKWTPDMLEDLKNGKLAGYDEDDLYDDEGDEILFEDDAVAVDLGHGHNSDSDDEMADELSDETERPMAMASPVAAIVAGVRPGSREWFESTQMGRAVAARWAGPTATADRKSREAWLADRAQPELPEAQRLFMAALDKAQVERRAMTVAELSDACGRSQRQTYRWVEKLRDAGQLIRVEEGRYTRP